MKNKLSRRQFGKVAGGITAAAAITSPMSVMKNAFAADNLSVVDWGPPWIDNTKKIAASWGKVRYNLDFAFRWCSFNFAKNKGCLAKSAL